MWHHVLHFGPVANLGHQNKPITGYHITKLCTSGLEEKVLCPLRSSMSLPIVFFLLAIFWLHSKSISHCLKTRADVSRMSKADTCSVLTDMGNFQKKGGGTAINVQCACNVYVRIVSVGELPFVKTFRQTPASVWEVRAFPTAHPEIPCLNRRKIAQGDTSSSMTPYWNEVPALARDFLVTKQIHHDIAQMTFHAALVCRPKSNVECRYRMGACLCCQVL